MGSGWWLWLDRVLFDNLLLIVIDDVLMVVRLRVVRLILVMWVIIIIIIITIRIRIRTTSQLLLPSLLIHEPHLRLLMLLQLPILFPILQRFPPKQFSKLNRPNQLHHLTRPSPYPRQPTRFSQLSKTQSHRHTSRPWHQILNPYQLQYHTTSW